MPPSALPAESLVPILEAQGCRELVSAHLFATGVALAPTIDDKHMLADHAREELGHFELVAALYERVTSRPLYEEVSARAAATPSPTSWLEAAVAGYLFDRAASVQLAAYKAVGEPRLAELIDEILEHEHEHQAAAETALLDQCRSNTEAAREAAPLVARWHRIAVESLDAGAESARVRGAFADSVRQTLATCGLSVPPSG